LHRDGSVEESVSVSCKNCSTSGTVEITEGVFSVNGSSFFTEVENFVHHGYFKAVANGVGAYIELEPPSPSPGVYLLIVLLLLSQYLAFR
jgi:hypothetical protein